jgi:hypothetical protein
MKVRELLKALAECDDLDAEVFVEDGNNSDIVMETSRCTGSYWYFPATGRGRQFKAFCLTTSVPVKQYNTLKQPYIPNLNGPFVGEGDADE